MTTTDFFDLDAAPLRVDTVTLKVRDLERVARFYRGVLGLTEVEAGADRATLGVGGRPLLVLEGDSALAPLDARQAGLFHTAFLLPGRADLARWLAHAGRSGVTLQGASDHLVSEALYLADPEGNGIEIYADRPVSAWRRQAGQVRMATDPRDLQDLLRAAGATQWDGFPEGGRIGHVHLQVGDTAAADGFYADLLGFDISARYPGASFYGSGGYHHQLAGNVWHSRGAGRRPEGAAGLAEVRLRADEADARAIAGRVEAAGQDVTWDGARLTLADPWGTRVSIVAGEAA